ncbi:MAG: cytochrome b [Alphaproteobacteria bacterium]|nr:MAG: cytochrome b [Alphaproteobacteria bacterium]
MATSKTTYTSTAKAFHWVLALAIIGMLCMGLYMEDLPYGALKFQLLQLHKSIGITILMLVAARLLWRFTHPAPMLPVSMPLWQKAAAHTTHTLLYVLMFAMPLSGYLMSDAAGYHPNWFGINVPILMQANPQLAQTFNWVHGMGANIFWALLAAHVGAALFHHVIVKDNTLRRMLPETISRRLP